MLAAGSASQAVADPVLTFDPSTGITFPNGNQTVGWAFTVRNSITVTGLGWYDEGGDGLATAHTVGIWAPDGTLLTSVLVPAGTAAPLDGQFRTIAITPIVLPLGGGYIIGGENFESSTERLARNVTQTVDPRILYLGPQTSAVGVGFVRPTAPLAGGNGLYGPSFSVQPAAIPEPATVLLLSIGLAGIVVCKTYRRDKGKM